MVSSNNIDDCTITAHDVKNDHTIFGPDLAGVRGKTAKHKHDHITIGYIDITRDFLKLHKYVTIVVDVMFVDNIPCLITMSSGIRFITFDHVPTHTAKQISRIIKRIIRLYSRGNMVVQTILMDMYFGKTIYEMMNHTVVNTSDAKEDVGEIDRCIHTG